MNDKVKICLLADNQFVTRCGISTLLTDMEVNTILWVETTKEIAYEKNLSFHTVNSHRKNIFRKLEVNNVHEAIKYAIRAGIYDAAEYYI